MSRYENECVGGVFCYPTEIHGEIDWRHIGVPNTYLNIFSYR